MKFRFDLLPVEYKSLPRDSLGIALAVLTIIGSISAIGSTHFKNTRELSQYQAMVNETEQELREVVDATGKLQPPTTEINSLVNSINFINENLDTPGSSLVDFLAAFESTIPDRVVITDLSPKSFTGTNRNFSITGEAATVFDVIDFTRRMNDSGKFRSFLRSNTAVNVEDGSMTRFTMDFTYIPGK